MCGRQGAMCRYVELDANATQLQTCAVCVSRVVQVSAIGYMCQLD